ISNCARSPRNAARTIRGTLRAIKSEARAPSNRNGARDHLGIRRLCATCKIRITEGEVDHGEASTFALMDFERDEGLALACCAQLVSDLVIEAEIEQDPDAQDIPVEDFYAEVIGIEQVTPTIRAIKFKLDRALQFQAGQYVNLDIPGKDRTTRAFSLANDPASGDEIELNIRKVPGGRATTWLHEEIAEGDRLCCKNREA
ncbi:2Fe-2S iron-sulfur cluster binding domain-containing protein, partial [Sphingomonas sp. SRS2]|uniref:2Fe-2S iron-sulfur cluster binding domain-containing protein n=1 Tax=Sphingomonas sp. SRS2 TaxID=133190 RepID=UPI000B1CC0F0